MMREMTPAEFERLRANAEDGNHQMLAWIGANRDPGETWEEARTRYRVLWTERARAEIRNCVEAINAARVARVAPTVKEDRVITRPISPLRRWMESVRGRVEPSRAPSPTENALDTSAASLFRDR